MTATLDMTIRDIVAKDFRVAAVFQRHGIARRRRTAVQLLGSGDAGRLHRRQPSWFVRQAIPALLTHTRKIASVHGGSHPELHEVAALFDGVAAEMTSHMMKEEEILFPYIAGLAMASRGESPVPSAPFGTVRNPIRMMEAEHESVGDAMARIRELTDGYRVPAEACTTYRVCLQELEAFERDLHEHVHLENNILFPKSARLESETR